MKVTAGVLDVIVYPSASDKSKNRGFAFVEYDSHRSAAMARKKLINNRTQLFGCNIGVHWAEPKLKVDANIMSQVRRIRTHIHSLYVLVGWPYVDWKLSPCDYANITITWAQKRYVRVCVDRRLHSLSHSLSLSLSLSDHFSPSPSLPCLCYHLVISVYPLHCCNCL